MPSKRKEDKMKSVKNLKKFFGVVGCRLRQGGVMDGIKKWTMAMIAMGVGGPALAQVQALDRAFPPSAKYCESTAHGLPGASSATLKGLGQVGLSPALVIRDQSNRVVVNSALPQRWAGMCSMGIGGALEKIWLLSPDQAKRAKERRAEQASVAGQ
jgi:hypothetical protein